MRRFFVSSVLLLTGLISQAQPKADIKKTINDLE